MKRNFSAVTAATTGSSATGNVIVRFSGMATSPVIRMGSDAFRETDATKDNDRRTEIAVLTGSRVDGAAGAAAPTADIRAAATTRWRSTTALAMVTRRVWRTRGRIAASIPCATRGIAPATGTTRAATARATNTRTFTARASSEATSAAIRKIAIAGD